MKAKRWPALLLAGVVLLGTTLVFAQGRGHGKQEEAEAGEEHNAHGKGKPVFTARDIDVIRGYFHDTANLPPGLAKRGGNLPPGLQKQLQRNGTLPPGLQKRLTPFPPDLLRQLPTLPEIYERGVIGPDAVIIDTRTQRIVDIVHAIFGR